MCSFVVPKRDLMMSMPKRDLMMSTTKMMSMLSRDLITKMLSPDRLRELVVAPIRVAFCSSLVARTDVNTQRKLTKLTEVILQQVNDYAAFYGNLPYTMQTMFRMIVRRCNCLP